MIWKEGPTPNGGAYATIYFYNKDGQQVDNEEKAYKIIAHEYNNDGKIIKTTYGIVEKVITQMLTKITLFNS